MMLPILLAAVAGLAVAHPSSSHHHKRHTPSEIYRRAASNAAAGKSFPIPAEYPNDRAPPAQWALDLLEAYKTYHFRYLAIDCQNMHDTEFFDACCHPRFATTTDADVPFECRLSSHIEGVSKKKLNAAIAHADSQASSQRFAEIVSISSASVANISSISASKQSASSASEASVSSTHAAHLASRSSLSAASAESIASEKSASRASREAKTSSSSSSPSPTPTPHPHPTSTAAQEQPTTTSSGGDSSSGSGGDSGSGSGGDSGSGSGGGSSDGEYQYGWDYGTPAYATWYKQANTIGACALQSAPISDWESVIALRYDFYKPEYCGTYVNIKNLENGKTVRAMVNDMCEGCVTEESIDLSLGAFSQIGDFAAGMYKIDWGFEK